MYRLPNNKITEDKDLHIAMWQSLGRRVKEILNANAPVEIGDCPIWQVSGFDPGIQLVSKDRVLLLPSDVALTIVLACDGGYHNLHPELITDEMYDETYKH